MMGYGRERKKGFDIDHNEPGHPTLKREQPRALYSDANTNVTPIIQTHNILTSHNPNP